MEAVHRGLPPAKARLIVAGVALAPGIAAKATDAWEAVNVTADAGGATSGILSVAVTVVPRSLVPVIVNALVPVAVPAGKHTVPASMPNGASRWVPKMDCS